MPIIPIEPAKATKIVLPFLVIKLLKDKDNAVKKDIAVFLLFSLLIFLFSLVFFLPLYGLLSLIILPSLSLIILVE